MPATPIQRLSFNTFISPRCWPERRRSNRSYLTAISFFVAIRRKTRWEEVITDRARRPPDCIATGRSATPAPPRPLQIRPSRSVSQSASYMSVCLQSSSRATGLQCRVRPDLKQGKELGPCASHQQRSSLPRTNHSFPKQARSQSFHRQRPCGNG